MANKSVSLLGEFFDRRLATFKSAIDSLSSLLPPSPLRATAAGNPAAFVLLAGDFNSGAGSPDTALWPFVTGQEAPFLLLTSPGPHAGVGIHKKLLPWLPRRKPGAPISTQWPEMQGSAPKFSRAACAPCLPSVPPPAGSAHATALNVRSRAALDFAVNVQQQLWVLGPKVPTPFSSPPWIPHREDGPEWRNPAATVVVGFARRGISRQVW